MGRRKTTWFAIVAVVVAGILVRHLLLPRVFPSEEPIATAVERLTGLDDIECTKEADVAFKTATTTDAKFPIYGCGNGTRHNRCYVRNTQGNAADITLTMREAGSTMPCARR